MEIFLLIVALVLLVVLLFRASRHEDTLRQLDNTIHLLHNEIKILKGKVSAPSPDIVSPQAPLQTKEEQAKRPETFVPVPKPVTQMPPPQPKQPEPALFTNEPKEQPAPINPVPRPVAIAKPVEPQESAFAKWLAKNPDIEKFIGENLINKIGIAILVLGIAFFVKYAIDQEWIGEVGRVSIGLLCGAILQVLAHRLRENYRPFSSVLAGGGITVFYFTIAFAFHQYHLFSQTVAFIIMVIITIFAILISILYDRIELGIIATLGGFLTPFLVSTGEGNYITLFTYLAILNTGLIVLANYKQWRPINFIAFFFTVLIYGGFIVTKNDLPNFSYIGVFLFGTVFYIMFVVMNLIYHVAKKGKLKAFDFIILLSINLAYFAAGYYLLKHWQHFDYTGLFTAALGLINLMLSYVLFKRQGIDRNFIFLLIGITLSFISLAAPVQLKGNYITMFWAAELVVLFWLYQKSGIQLMKIASAIITLLVAGSLIMDWVNVYGNETVIPVIINKGFITSAVVSIAMYVMYALMRKDENGSYVGSVTNKEVKVLYVILGTSILFIAGCLEINYQFRHRYPSLALEDIYLPLFVHAFVIAAFFALHYFKVQVGKVMRIVVPAILFMYYLINNFSVYDLEKEMLANHIGTGHFVVHWFGVILYLVVIGLLVQYIIRHKKEMGTLVNAFACATTIVLIVVLSIEIQHLYVWCYVHNADQIQIADRIFSKAGLSILWGISSFIIIWLGMRYHFKMLRIIALCLFGVTIVKLFAYDLSNISPGGKIAAFILLGGLLLTVSFMYQRLKKIIIDDKPIENNDDKSQE
jgi:uncharacterized membrane protein